MTKQGYARVVLEWTKPEEKDNSWGSGIHLISVGDFYTGFEYVLKHWPGWISEEIQNGPTDFFEEFFKDKEDGVYEIYGEFWYDWYWSDTPDGREFESDWDIQNIQEHKLTEEEFKHYIQDVEEEKLLPLE